MVGIAFTDQHLLGGEVSPNLRILKQIWQSARQLQG